mmetsp:Transcript_11494/g.25080  ORF Transcript_11494/g.25080 Transcript_11494/m.25080 type:complete len:648 (-) Transcript_11494:37-1980(-)
MHAKNLEMKTLREDMERKMRFQLNKMDISYQMQAFSALSEAHKQAMYQNSKLKDEVALQGTGLNNLGSRLGKQNQQFEICSRELHVLETKSSKLKMQLGIKTSEKKMVNQRKTTLADEKTGLLAKQLALQGRVQAPPLHGECVQERDKLYLQQLHAQCAVSMWSLRLRRLQEVYRDIKPVSDNEQLGRFNKHVFALEASASLQSLIEDELHLRPATVTRQDSLGGDTGTLSEASVGSHSLYGTGSTARPFAIKPAEILELVARDKSLAQALQALHGKESSLLTMAEGEGERGQRDQNMVAWTTLQIVDMWERTRTDADELLQDKLEGVQGALELAQAEATRMKNAQEFAKNVYREIQTQKASRFGLHRARTSAEAPFHSLAVAPAPDLVASASAPSVLSLLRGTSVVSPRHACDQKGRGTIESGELEAGVLEEIWNQALSPTLDRDTGMPSPSTKWLRPVAAVRRLPHPLLPHNSPKHSSPRLPRPRKRSDSWDDLLDRTAAPAVSSSKAIKNCNRDMRDANLALQEYLADGAAPPMLMYDKTVALKSPGKSAPLPPLEQASVPPSLPLLLSEEGVVLRDPLMRKNFRARQAAEGGRSKHSSPLPGSRGGTSSLASPSPMKKTPSAMSPLMSPLSRSKTLQSPMPKR